MEVSLAYWEAERRSLRVTITSDLSLHEHKRQPGAPTTAGPRIHPGVQKLPLFLLSQSSTSLVLVTSPLQVLVLKLSCYGFELLPTHPGSCNTGKALGIHFPTNTCAFLSSREKKKFCKPGTNGCLSPMCPRNTHHSPQHLAASFNLFCCGFFSFLFLHLFFFIFPDWHPSEILSSWVQISSCLSTDSGRFISLHKNMYCS